MACFAKQLKNDPAPARRRRRHRLTLWLPDKFLDLCAADGVEAAAVLRGFIADLAEIVEGLEQRGDFYASNGSAERLAAQHYYDRVGYPWWRG